LIGHEYGSNRSGILYRALICEWDADYIGSQEPDYYAEKAKSKSPSDKGKGRRRMMATTTTTTIIIITRRKTAVMGMGNARRGKHDIERLNTLEVSLKLSMKLHRVRGLIVKHTHILAKSHILPVKLIFIAGRFLNALKRKYRASTSVEALQIRSF
jgi:hypothetical protein